MAQELCVHCKSIHSLASNILSGEDVFGCQLDQEGFETNHGDEAAGFYEIEMDGTARIFRGPDGKLHEFSWRGNSWFKYVRPFDKELCKEVDGSVTRSLEIKANLNLN